MTDDLIPIPTLTDTMAAELVGKPVGDLAAARARAEAEIAFSKHYGFAHTAVRVSDLSLILALPDREAVKKLVEAAYADAMTGDWEVARDTAADRILSHLKGESSND